MSLYNCCITKEYWICTAAIEIEKQKLQANKYIKKNEELFENIMSVFRTYSKTFYKDKASGLDIKVNDGANQLRSISTLKDVAHEEEYNHYSKLIEDNTILSLTDKCDEDKLLGMTIDIPYDK